MWAPAIIALTISSFVIAIVRDSPESLNRVDAESAWAMKEAKEAAEEVESSEEEGWMKAMEEEAAASDSSGGGTSGGSEAAVVAAAKGSVEPPMGMLERLRKKVLSKPQIWLLAFSFLCVYLMRQGLTTWMVFYLIEEKGIKDFAQAAARVSGLELGGLVGSLIAGKLSDQLIKEAKPGEGHVGKRLFVVRSYLLMFAATLAVLFAVPMGAVAQWIAVFMVGFFLYGPQMLIGLCGAELVGRDSVGASEGFLGWVAYLGAASAGYPLSLLVKRCGWPIFFRTLIATSGVAFLLLSTIGNARSFQQRELDGDP